MTGEEILLLDRYCRERFIDLLPNQNSFGPPPDLIKGDDWHALNPRP